MKFSLRTVYPLLFWTMIVLCFFVFPIFLLNLTANRYFGLVEREQAAADYLSARKILAQVQRNSDNARYLHLIFSSTFEQSKMSANVVEDLSARIAGLKRNFAGSLEFIVWDTEGNLVKNLSDNTDYNFLKKRLNIFLRELRKQAHAGVNLKNLSSDLKKQVRSFREFLGPFISSSRIAESFLPGNLGSCFKMHGKGRHAWGWYTAQPGFSIFIYVSHELASSLIYPELFCQKYRSPTHKFFLVNEKNWQVRPAASTEQKHQLLFNLARHSSLTPPEQIVDRNFLFSYQRITPEWWLAAVTGRSQISAGRISGRKLMAKTLLAMLIGLFVLRCYFLVHLHFFTSIRGKLMAIFAYTVAVPLMIFATVGFEYMAQKQKSVESQFGLELAEILTRMDLQFELFLKEQADKVSTLANRVFRQSSAGNFPENAAEQFVSDFVPLAVLLVDSEGNNLLPKKYAANAASFTLFRTLVADLLEFLNESDFSEIRPFKVVSESMLQSHARVDQAIRIFQHSYGEMYFYQYALRPYDDKFYRYCLQLFWDKEALQESFFAAFARRLQKVTKAEPTLFFPVSRRLASQSKDWQGAGEFFDQIALHGLHVEKITLAGKSYIAAGMRGQSLSDAVVAVFLDADEIASELSRLKRELWFLFFAMVILAGALYRSLNFQILNPVNELVAGVEMIHAGAYSYRIPVESENELGRLCKSVNHALENLQELAIAQVVQEALLPDNLPGLAGYEVYAGTRPMTRLGGDYYDFFVNRSGELVVVMADVAGHGTQAALLMAMAKAAFVVGRNNADTGMAIMQKLNQTFCHLRKSSIRTMLTCQVLTFLPDSGECILINAGHCPPLTIKRDQQVVINHFRTFPLGYSSSRTFEQRRIELDRGDTLLLYSDGIIEALNEREEMLGENGFVELVKASSSNELKAFYDEMYARYEKWRAVQSDDITFVLVRRTADES